MQRAVPDTPSPASGDSAVALWPQLEDIVPPDLPPEIAAGRLVALARSLMIENRQLRELLQGQYVEERGDQLDSLHPFDGGAAA